MRFGGHQTFHLRDNWLYKGIDLLAHKGDTFSDPEKSMRHLGVGSNMVSAIKYWLEATGTVEKNTKGKISLTDFAESLRTFDPYFEWHGTAWLIHYKLATNSTVAPVFFWFFNKFGVSEFNVESATNYLDRYVSSLRKKVNENTLNRDIHVLLRTYLPTDFDGKETPEDNAVSPLSTLNLIERNAVGYKLVPKTATQIPAEIFGIGLLEFWEHQLNSANEFKFDELWKRDCSPGKVFNLNSSETLEALDVLVEKFPSQFSYKRSGGYFSVNIRNPSKTNLLKSYYEVIDG